MKKPDFDPFNSKLAVLLVALNEIPPKLIAGNKQFIYAGSPDESALRPPCS